MKNSIRRCKVHTLAITGVLAALLCLSASTTVRSQEAQPVETFRYSIYKLLIKLGTVTLEYMGPAEVDGQPAELIRFTATGPNFFDEDNIYIDPQTYRPIKVDRTIRIFGRDEVITEYYDQKVGSVRIVKTVGDTTEEQVIEKDGPLDNIYGFMQKFRQEESLDVGDEVFIRLPTKDLTMRYVDQREFKWEGEQRNVAYLESDPSQFRIWFDIERDMLPLRIDGAVGFGKTAMILKEYSRR